MRSAGSASLRTRNCASSARVDVVGDDRDVVLLAQRLTERQRQRGLAGTDRAADADSQRAPRGCGGNGLSLIHHGSQDRNNRVYWVSWRLLASVRAGVKFSQSLVSARRYRIRGQRGKGGREGREHALTGGLAERDQLHRGHHLILQPCPQPGCGRIPLLYLPVGGGRRPGARIGDLGRASPECPARCPASRAGRAAGGPTNSPICRVSALNSALSRVAMNSPLRVRISDGSAADQARISAISNGCLAARLGEVQHIGDPLPRGLFIRDRAAFDRPFQTLGSTRRRRPAARGSPGAAGGASARLKACRPSRGCALRLRRARRGGCPLA